MAADLIGPARKVLIAIGRAMDRGERPHARQVEREAGVEGRELHYVEKQLVGDGLLTYGDAAHGVYLLAAKGSALYRTLTESHFQKALARGLKLAEAVIVAGLGVVGTLGAQRLLGVDCP